MKLKTIIFFGVILLLTACHNTIEKSNKRLSIDMTCIADYELNDIGSNFKIRPLATIDSALIGRIAKIIYYENNLFIMDKKQKAIFIYNMDGEFIRKIRKVGRGPEEYLCISDFTINQFNNHIEMTDGRSLRSYDFYGNFIGKENIQAETGKFVHCITVIDSSTVAFLSFNEEAGASIYSRDKKKFVVSQSLVPAWNKRKIPFQTASPLYNNNNHNIYFEGFSNKIYQIDKNGFSLKYEWDFGDYNFNYDKPPLVNEFKKVSSSNEFIKNKNLYNKCLDKYIIPFQHHIENEKLIVTCFLFKGKPATLVYNKLNNKYIIIKGDLSKLLMFSKIEITESNEIIAVADPVLINKMPERWLVGSNKKIVSNIKISDNPVIVSFKIKDELFQNK